MSTRSRIGIENEDGTVNSIYCHSDGYLSYNGQMLIDHYTKPEKVRELIALGDISVLKPLIGEKHDFDWRSEFYAAGKYDDIANDPRDDMVLAYGRDRGEEGVEGATDESAAAMFQRATDGWEEYAYLFRDGEWFFSKVGGACGPMMGRDEKPEDWTRVTDGIALENAEREAEEAASAAA